jgi:RNA polymerase sigma-70 factor (ECF subfamily)
MVYSEACDEILAIKLSCGDNIAFEVIYQRYYSSAYNIFLKRLSNKESAEDATHDLFVKLRCKIKTFDKVRCFKAWFLIVAKRFAIDILRRRKNQISLDIFNAKNSVECYLEKLSYNEDLLENITTEENINLVKKVFNQMSDTHKKVLIYYYFDDLSSEEIAVLMNTPIGTVKSRISRALGLFREFLGNIKGELN